MRAVAVALRLVAAGPVGAAAAGVAANVSAATEAASAVIRINLVIGRNPHLFQNVAAGPDALVRSPVIPPLSQGRLRLSSRAWLPKRKGFNPKRTLHRYSAVMGRSPRKSPSGSPLTCRRPPKRNVSVPAESRRG